MYYVPDKTMIAGFYECKKCSERFLSVQIMPKCICPYCGETPDMEIGPDDVMPDACEDAVLLEVIEGEDNVERMDGLLSLALTGGDYEWL
ncbi:MAG: hypothetical protein KBT19_03170 [Lachnospiraceae bacterium]|nr:hypothetical protein [Candidatus Colinaster equi]